MPPKRPASAPPIDPSFQPVVDAFAGDPAISLGKMLVSAGLRVNGKTFAFGWKGKLVVKLPKERAAALVADRVGAHLERGEGKPMKEWLTVAPGKADWIALAEEARVFVAGAALRSASPARSPGRAAPSSRRRG